MDNFIVCPPIKDNLDYYRFDDAVVQNILDGQSTLAVGLRRSGKTSFLYKIKWTASKSGKTCLFFDCGSFFLENPLDEVTNAIDLINNTPEGIILLDEVETFEGNDAEILALLLKNCRDRSIVMTCAPRFVLRLPEYPRQIQNFIAECHRHQIGPLSDVEAQSLLSQDKRYKESSLSEKTISEILLYEDRLPIILQALGTQAAGKTDLRISLAGVGSSILQGLTEKARNLLINAAHADSCPAGTTEALLLEALGALHSRDNTEELAVAGDTLKNLIRESSAAPDRVADELETPPLKQNWTKFARILHLSDLHFGPHCIDTDTSSVNDQFTRLITALKRDEIVPDFVVVTGDLSWSGHRDELKIAEQFLEELVIWLSKTANLTDLEARERILLIPGNHEAAWALTNGLEQHELEDWCCYSLAPFANMINRFYRGRVIWDLENPCQVRFFETHSLAFISISTVHKITKKQNFGEFGSPVRERVKDLLEADQVRAARFRIGLFHHNIRPFHDDGVVIRDGESFLIKIGQCKPPLDLFLHGHVHQGEVEAYRPKGGLQEVPYSAVGSFGVRAEHRPGDDIKGKVPNEFAILDLEVDGTGRRFCTRFYQLVSTTTLSWEWQLSQKCKAVIL